MVSCSAVHCNNRSSTLKKSPDSLPMKMFNFPKDIHRRKLWINAMKRSNWTPTDNSRVCQVHFEESMFLRKSSEGRWRLVHDAVPTLFKHTKIKKKRKPPFNRNKDAEELLRKQKIILLEHSYAKTNGESNKEDDPYTDHEVKSPTSSDVFVQEAPEIEVKTYVPCSKCINLVYGNKYLSSKIQKLQAKLSKNKASKKSTKKRSKWISKKTQSCHKNYAEGFLNEDQLKYLAEKGKKSKIIWSSPTINKALKLKYACGSSGYETLLDQGFPLPSLRTLRRKLNATVPSINIEKDLEPILPQKE
ncbi:uncharacterized protein [Lepeophtheirus salmonis]|uniref:uncharacterized protein isoform X1 n=2 Tax=Lepeophtheirus salmonis TaxID=72036 RepID=UPI001AE7FB5C|nr:uncharacterized protein LOC121121987 [Lepeophtheirus salmonis]